MPNEIVRFSHVSMQFPGTLANDDISLSIYEGEVFALVGENGAGKSTLMNLLYGLHQPTLGEIRIGGVPTGNAHSPEKAMQMGVSMVHQHFKLVPSFTVAQNILLGHEPKKLGVFYDGKRAEQLVRELSETYGLEVNPSDVVRDLSIGLQQRVEILKALRTGAKVLILDEPTAVLTAQEFLLVDTVVPDSALDTDTLFQIIDLFDQFFPGISKRAFIHMQNNNSNQQQRHRQSYTYAGPLADAFCRQLCCLYHLTGFHLHSSFGFVCRQTAPLGVLFGQDQFHSFRNGPFHADFGIIVC